MPLDADACFRALCARDDRFDGVFFVGVKTTGIYCRPVCAARTPGRDRCVFFARAAEAERDGFRACFRCRPERAPGAAPVDAVSRIATAALASIDAVASGEASVEDLAARLGVSGRHLRRAVVSELGVSPIELVSTRRLALARQLLMDTAMPITELALASGFGSIRRFNDAFRLRYGRAPSELRRADAAPGDRLRGARGEAGTRGGAIELRLDVRAPFDWDGLRDFFAVRAVPGVESVDDDELRRTARIGAHQGIITVRPIVLRRGRAGGKGAARAAESDRGIGALAVTVSQSLAGVLIAVVARVRRMLDVDARPALIAEHLGRDAKLAALVRARPGLRLPGAFDGFEIATRAVLGQQVSVAGARTLAGRLVQRFGPALSGAEPGLDRVWPNAEEIATASVRDIAAIGLPAARAEALSALARAVVDGRVTLEPPVDPDGLQRTLRELPGFGPWTASYVAMRALGWPDAFLEGDLVIRRALGGATEKACLARAEAWRPWRAYVVMHLWASEARREK